MIYGNVFFLFFVVESINHGRMTLGSTCASTPMTWRQMQMPQLKSKVSFSAWRRAQLNFFRETSDKYDSLTTDCVWDMSGLVNAVSPSCVRTVVAGKDAWIPPEWCWWLGGLRRLLSLLAFTKTTAHNKMDRAHPCYATCKHDPHLRRV